jgi:hypothetical protein
VSAFHSRCLNVGVGMNGRAADLQLAAENACKLRYVIYA